MPQDVIYVGGGNTANMLAVWRVHGVDKLLREAWESGTVLCGVSAGAICWFEAGLTDSFGPDLQPLHGGLGFLPGSFCPHYDGEAARRPGFTSAIASGALPPGYAADDGVGVLFEGTALAEIAASRPKVSAYRVDRNGETAERASAVMRPPLIRLALLLSRGGEAPNGSAGRSPMLLHVHARFPNSFGFSRLLSISFTSASRLGVPSGTTPG